MEAIMVYAIGLGCEDSTLAAERNFFSENESLIFGAAN